MKLTNPFVRKNIIKRNEDNIILAAAIVTLAVHVVQPTVRFVKSMLSGTPADVEAGATPFRKVA